MSPKTSLIPMVTGCVNGVLVSEVGDLRARGVVPFGGIGERLFGRVVGSDQVIDLVGEAFDDLAGIGFRVGQSRLGACTSFCDG